MLADDVTQEHKIAWQLIIEDMQNDIDAVAKWADANCLPPSEFKSCYLQYDNICHHFVCYFPDGVQISKLSETYALSVLRCNSFDYSKHIQSIASSTRSLIRMIRKVIINKNRLFQTWLDLYKSFIKSKLEYAFVILNPCNKAGTAQFEGVHKAFPKNCKGLNKKSYQIFRLQMLENVKC